MVSPRGQVFGAGSSEAAAAALGGWLSADSERSVRNATFIGHGNDGFAWSVSVGRSGRLHIGAGQALAATVTRNIVRDDAHSRFLALLERAMGSSSEKHVVEFRACSFSQDTVDNMAFAFGAGARRSQSYDRHLEVRGYSDHYAIIVDSSGGFRSEIQDLSGGAVVSRRPGVAAPPAQLLSCLSGRQLIQGTACP